MLKSSVLSTVNQKQVSVYHCDYANDYNDGKLDKYLCIDTTCITVAYYCQV